MFGSILLALLVSIPVSIIAEIALLSKNIAYRPSWAIAKLGSGIRWTCFQLYYCLFLVTDLGRFIKRFALFVRDVFFRFIPRDVIIKAIDDLWTSLGTVVRAPYGIIEGIRAGLKEVRLPWLSASLVVAVNIFTFLVVPVIIEVVTFTRGYETRPTTLLRDLALFIYEHARDTTFGLRYIWNWKNAVVAFVSRFLAWIAPEIIKDAAHSLYTEAISVVTAGACGILMGMCLLVSPNDVCVAQMDVMMTYALKILGAFIAVAVIAAGFYWAEKSSWSVPVVPEPIQHRVSRAVSSINA